MGASHLTQTTVRRSHDHPGSGNVCAVRDVEVEFAVRDGVRLAFEIFGRGPMDLVVATGSRFPIDLMWDLPQLAEFMDTLGSVARVIAYDGRGAGASDPIPTTEGAAGLEDAAASMLAVIDAVGSDRVSILDLAHGAAPLFFAVTYPERAHSLILSNLRASFPELRGFTLEQRTKMAEALSTTRGLRSDNPRVAHDPELQRWWGRARRLVSSPAATARMMEWASQVDVEALLPHVKVPTLVFHRTGGRVWDVATSRASAARIPNSRFVELAGSEHDIFLGDTAPVLAEITRFLSLAEGGVGPADDERPLATVLFTDIVASTEQLTAVGDRVWRQILDEHDEAIERTVSAHRGRVVKTTGDGMLATFDGPARAVRCAAAIRDTLAEHRITVRAGLHTGEIEIRGADVAGIAVHIASRVSALADPGDILVTRTVVDLTGGSGITYDIRGDYELKGLPGTTRIFAAQT
jgi:class 3 adenylate cyclase